MHIKFTSLLFITTQIGYHYTLKLGTFYGFYSPIHCIMWEGAK